LFIVTVVEREDQMRWLILNEYADFCRQFDLDCGWKMQMGAPSCGEPSGGRPGGAEQKRPEQR